MLEGVKIMVGGVEMIMPPLNVKQCKKYWRAIVTGDYSDPDFMPGLVFAALSRNYPELSQDEMEDKMLPGALMRAFSLLMPISGFDKQAPVGESRRGSAKTRIGTG